jgi:hypothetical protein
MQIIYGLLKDAGDSSRPELSTHPDNAGYTQDLDQILISNSPEMYPGRILCRKTRSVQERTCVGSSL